MKQILNTLFYLMLISSTTFGQAKKPTIMILPSDVWCKTNGYMQVFDNQGTKQEIPDYKKAFQSNTDLINVISKINGMMAERDFPLKNAESEIKKLEAENAEDNLLTGKSSGAAISETPIDKLLKTVKPDIILQLTWTLNQTGPKKSITFNLQGLDAYTSKQVATAQGTGAPSFSAEIPVLLEEAVISQIDNFNTTLLKHFDDMFANGREAILRIKKFDSWDGDLTKEFGGKELNDIIENWVRENSVENRFSLTNESENMMLFEQVRIPMYDAAGNALDARNFFKPLSKMLNAAPYSIPNNFRNKGLGQVTIVLGEK